MENLRLELGLVLLLAGLACLAATDAQSLGRPASRLPPWAWWIIFACAGLMGLAGSSPASNLLSITARLASELVIVWVALTGVRYFRGRLALLRLRREVSLPVAKHFPAAFLLLAVIGMVVGGWLGRSRPPAAPQYLVAASTSGDASAKSAAIFVATPCEPRPVSITYPSRRWAKALPLILIMVVGFAVAAAANSAAGRSSRPKPLVPGGQTSR